MSSKSGRRQRERTLSRSERYLIDRYGARSLQEAVDAAAEMQRGRRTEERVPVWQLIRSHGIQVSRRRGHFTAQHPHARLLPSGGRFVIELREGLSPRRERFALAHELGHTLFYRQDGDRGLRHVVGVLEAEELKSEERLCNRFSRALLIPQTIAVRQSWSGRNDPSFLLSALVAGAGRFGVSIPALIDRIVDLAVPMMPCVVVHMRYTENNVTKENRALRVVRSYSLGGTAKRLYVWRNRTAARIGMTSAEALFDSWRIQAAIKGESEQDAGVCYLWSRRRGLRCAGPAFAEAHTEDAVVSIYCTETDSWAREEIPVRTASCLFASRNAREQDAHVLSVLMSNTE